MFTYAVSVAAKMHRDTFHIRFFGRQELVRVVRAELQVTFCACNPLYSVLW